MSKTSTIDCHLSAGRLCCLLIMLKKREWNAILQYSTHIVQLDYLWFYIHHLPWFLFISNTVLFLKNLITLY